MTNVDIKLFLQPQGYYDIDLDDEGDLAKVQGLETALAMSLFCEARAASSEVADPPRQRGWWGNTVNVNEGYEIGSKLWLLEQARVNYDTTNRAIDYAQDGLAWLATDKLADQVEVDASIDAGRSSIFLTVTIYRPQDIVLKNTYSLWEGTKLNYAN